MDFGAYRESKKKLIEASLRSFVKKLSGDNPKIQSAMEYSLMAPSKRFRPMLCLMTDDLLRNRFDDGHSKDAMKVAVAIEAIHTYSLIQDDLPAMDDDSIRRGKPSCHKQFGEATAILAADSLLIKAFAALADMETLHTRAIIKLITDYCGVGGLMAGQQFDLQWEGKKISAKSIEKLYLLKTSYLIQASVMSIALLHGEVTNKTALKTFATKLGLAFQATDDILDVTKSSSELGKDANSDLKNNKSTYISTFGLERATSYARELVDDARKALFSIKNKNTYYMGLLGEAIAARIDPST